MKNATLYYEYQKVVNALEAVSDVCPDMTISEAEKIADIMGDGALACRALRYDYFENYTELDDTDYLISTLEDALLGYADINDGDNYQCLIWALETVDEFADRLDRLYAIIDNALWEVKEFGYTL